MNPSAAATSASTGLVYSSSRRCAGSDPELTPIRSGVPASLARGHDLRDLVGTADVAGVQAHAVGTGVNRLQRQRVVEVDVGDHRDRRALDDRAQRLDVLLARHGAANDVRARLGHSIDLRHRRLEVGGLRLGHRLNDDRGSAADRNTADVDLAFGSHRPLV